MTTSKKFVKQILKNSNYSNSLNDDFFELPKDKQDTLDLLLESLAFAYKEDSTKPGVLISKVNKNGKVYYASILRFSSGSKQRTVVVSADAKNKDEAINKLAKKWVALQKTNPVDELKTHLSI